MKRFLIIMLVLITASAEVSYAVDCKVVITTDPAYNDKWYGVLPEAIPSIAKTSNIFEGQRAWILLFFTDYAMTPDDSVKIRFDLEIINPDGLEHFSIKGKRGAAAKSHNPSVMLLTETVPEMSFDSSDPRGKYACRVVVRDMTSGKTVEREVKFVVTALESDYPMTSEEELGHWITHYYEIPTPERAISAYLFFASTPLVDDENRFLPIFHFFVEVFSQNRFLIPAFLEEFDTQEKTVRLHMIYLLRHAADEDNPFFDELSEEDMGFFNKIKNQSRLDPYKPIEFPIQVDLLWSDFFATGTSKPLAHLVSALAFKKYSGLLDKKTEPADDENQQNVVRAAIYLSARWSLVSNCKQHTLVREYCKYLHERGDLSSAVRQELNKVIAESK